MTKPAETETALALFPKLNLPSVTKIAEEMNASFKTMYTRLEADIADLPTDMSVKANREKVASYAYRISRTKTALDEAATGVSGDAKKIVDAVNAERKELKTTLDALRDKARAALNTWEAEEEARLIRVRDLSMRLNNIEIELVGMSSAGLAEFRQEIEAIEISPELHGEDDSGLVDMMRKALATIEHEKRNAERREAEAAELEQLRREKAEREAAEAARIAEEERKAREAEEAARIQQEKDEAAERVRQQVLKDFQEAEEKAARDAAEKIAAEQKAREDAERRAQEAEEREAKRIEDEKRREADAIEAQKEAAARAEEDAKRREEKAKEDERQRLAKIAAEKERADQERAADIAHRKRLNGEAEAALMKVCGLSEKDAQAVVIAIYKEQVPHVAISY